MNLAFCNLAIVPLRAENNDMAEMVSQLLFGEIIELIDIKDNWTYIRCLYDNYEAWIDTKQYKIIDNSYEALLTLHISHACQQNDLSFPLILGSRLPNFDGINFKIEKQKFIYNGKAVDVRNNSLANIKKIAEKYLNAPYLWGGRSPFGIDCSGFSQMVFSFFNIALPRDAYMQANIGSTINFVGEARTGDLAFFGKDEKITHVGICLDNNEIIHASGKVRIDLLDHIGIYNREIKNIPILSKQLKG